MKILKDGLFKEDTFPISIEFDYSAETIDDALVEKITTAKVEITGYKIDEDEISLNVKVKSLVDYLDARTLMPLKLPINFEENIVFTTNEEKAKEYEIDFVESELDLYELIFELIIVNIPFSYSESEPITSGEEDFYDNKPFKDLLKK